MYESEFAIKRFQTYTPASGKIKTKKALTLLNEFIEDCFDKDGEIKVKEYTKNSRHSVWIDDYGNITKLCDAVDFDIRGLTAQQVRIEIIKNAIFFMYH